MYRIRNFGLGLILLTALIFPSPVWCQVVGASVTGTVRDVSGAPVPGSTIQVRNLENRG